MTQLAVRRAPGQSLVLCWNGPADATDAELAAALRALRIEVTALDGRRIGIRAPAEVAIWRGEQLERKEGA